MFDFKFVGNSHKFKLTTISANQECYYIVALPFQTQTMALSSAICPIVRQLHRLHHCPLFPRWLQGRLMHPVKLLHKSSIRPTLPSRIAGFFKASPKRSLELKQKDQIPKDYTLIYKAPMEDYMKYGYPITMSMFLAAPLILMYDYYIHGKILLRKEMHEIVFINPELEICVFAGAMVLCTLGICAVLFKYPVRLYKRNDQQEYIAMFLSAVPLRVRKFQYVSAAKKTFRNPLYFFVPDCHYVLEGNKKAILMPHYFRTPADLCEMIGMD